MGTMPRWDPRRAAELVTPVAANQVLYHFGLGGYRAGSFFAALLDAWDHADYANTHVLAEAYPAYGAALSLLGDDWSGAEQLREIAVRR